MTTLTTAQLEAGLGSVLEAPADSGTVNLIVCRPTVDARRILDRGWLGPDDGLDGDRWATGPRNPVGQITLMNTRFVDLIAGTRERWALAGDQLYVDLDLSIANLGVGSRLEVGESTLEVTEKVHRGCAKFAARFGPDALAFANSEVGLALRLRGMYARVIRAGWVGTGDAVRKL